MQGDHKNKMVKPMALKVTKEKGKYKLFLDEKKLHHVMQYKIESLQKGGYAELSIKMLVRYPVTQENEQNAKIRGITIDLPTRGTQREAKENK